MAVSNIHKRSFLTGPDSEMVIQDRRSFLTGPDSVMVRASASGAGVCGFEPGSRHTKVVKMVPVATLLGAQHS